MEGIGNSLMQGCTNISRQDTLTSNFFLPWHQYLEPISMKLASCLFSGASNFEVFLTFFGMSVHPWPNRRYGICCEGLRLVTVNSRQHGIEPYWNQPPPEYKFTAFEAGYRSVSSERAWLKVCPSLPASPHGSVRCRLDSNRGTNRKTTVDTSKLKC